ncbi:SusC/RagA family TonB-linked outer membrane protein [Flavobacterium sp. JP2137]|uniref:SusC/RagA family TonB-linked outer membrane protein n=1 Tax=Flavobacterium sp. JP2137 TaxID=3414510 RepID=UPI003D2FA433
MKKFTFAALSIPWFLVLLLLFCEYKTYAQERTITLQGVVKDANGPISGVTVWQKNTQNGTQSDSLGHYLLKVPYGALVSYEFIGYKSQTITVKNSIGNILLSQDESMMDDILINAGYYTVSDKQRTGSITKITSKEIGQQPVANPLAAMQGRMAGVNITQSSGTPGGGFDIQIRGRNSLRTEGNAPLYIVDGVPFASQSVSDIYLTAAMFAGNVSPLNSINPNDIESIEVLKDADATAIYGSRGSNGVVLITTKKGSSEKTIFSFQSTTSVSTVGKFVDLMNTSDYLKMRRDAYLNDGITELPENAYDVNGTWDKLRYTDWQKEFIGGQAISQNTQFSVGVGSGQTSYLLSASHRKDGTVYLGDFGYKRTNFLLNVNHQSKNERFKIQTSIQKSTQKNRLMAIGMTNHILLAPNAPELLTNTGELNWANNTFENPLAKLKAKYLSETDDFIGQLTMSYKIGKSFFLRLNAGTAITELDEFRTNPNTIYNPAYGLTSANSSLVYSSFKRKNWIVEPKINWTYDVSNGNFDVLLGTTFEVRIQEGRSITGSNFTSNDFILNLANATSQTVTRDTESVYRYTAVFGRLNYTHQGKYIVNLTGRRDGSSRFGVNNRFANFGAIGAAWLFSHEKIFEESSWLRFGKLRTSYGIAGSDLIGDYQYLDTFGISNQKYDQGVGLEPLRLYNPNFSWESNKKLEAALELELFGGKVAPSVAFYKNRSSNQLVGIPLPGTTGFNSVQENLEATIENTGWESTLRTLNLDKRDFQWTTSFNVSIPRNKLISFPNLEESTYVNQYVVGKPITIKKVYHYLGVNKQTGLYEVEDINNDGEITIEDQIKVVDIGVNLFGGITNNLQYKKWSLDFTWQFVQQKNYTPDYYGNLLGNATNAPQRSNDYFSQDNPDARYQKPTTGADAAAQQTFWEYRASDGVIVDASYIRLKTLQLQYDLSGKWLGNTKASLYLQGYNLLTFTKFWGSDPETIGVLLPSLRTIAFGFNLNF